MSKIVAAELLTPAGELVRWLAAPDKPGVDAVCTKIEDAVITDLSVEGGFPAMPVPAQPFVVADDFPDYPHDIVAVIGIVGAWTTREFSNVGPGIGECIFDVWCRSVQRETEASPHVARDRAWEWAVSVRTAIQRAEHWAPVTDVDYQRVKVTEIIHTRIEPLLGRPVMYFRASVERRPWV